MEDLRIELTDYVRRLFCDAYACLCLCNGLDLDVKASENKQHKNGNPLLNMNTLMHANALSKGPQKGIPRKANLYLSACVWGYLELLNTDANSPLPQNKGHILWVFGRSMPCP